MRRWPCPPAHSTSTGHFPAATAAGSCVPTAAALPQCNLHGGQAPPAYAEYSQRDAAADRSSGPPLPTVPVVGAGARPAWATAGVPTPAGRPARHHCTRMADTQPASSINAHRRSLSFTRMAHPSARAAPSAPTPSQQPSTPPTPCFPPSGRLPSHPACTHRFFFSGELAQHRHCQLRR